MDICETIDRLTDYAAKRLELDPRDAVYARNTVLAVLGVDSCAGFTGEGCGGAETPDALLSDLCEACVAAGVFAHGEEDKYRDAVMGALSLPPGEVEKRFARLLAEEGAKNATDWLYGYSVANDYVKKSVLDANPRFEADGLVITINKAKPEFRDPKKAASGNAVRGGYPRCTICRENEGFAGRNKRTLRTVSIKLGGEDWFWQYSPYGYFRQHGIAVNEKHIPMHVDRAAFTRLMDFADMFPHYFIGCNAALPRIGGSVLAHDHYQGGGETLPLHRAPCAVRMKCADFPSARIDVLDWPGTVVRVSGGREEVTELSDRIRLAWESFRSDELGIIPHDGEGQHNAVSPTVVRTPRGYEMNIILRSNITSARYPDGVFHAHPEFHVIKKESIGLIEAQGLFILPGRLDGQLSVLADCIAAGRALPEDMADFALVYEETRARCPSRPDSEDARGAVKEELGSICRRILGNTAVFKTPDITVGFLKGLGFACND